MMEAKQRALQRKRRVNIVAESYDVDTAAKTIVVPKSKAARDVIRAALDKHFIFSTSTPKDLEEMIDSMEEVKIDAGADLITQGEKGERFYVCETGSFTVLVDGKEVGEIQAGSSFGELALMDDSPRAATIRCKTKAKLWALGRHIFRRILANNTERTLDANLQFLKGVKLLKALTQKELRKLAEALQPVPFTDGTKIVSQGEEGNTFYIVAEGHCEVHKRQDDGTETKVMDLEAGDHFGERALQRNEPRAATVVAVGDVRCMALDRQSFTELLGSLDDILKMEHSKRLQLEKASMSEAAAPSELRSDIRLKDLRTIAVLGQGAFGQVKLVEHKKTKQVFALKVLQCVKVVRTKQEQNVVNEKRLMMECDHPYILKLFATFRDRACVYLLLEFLQGGDLFGHMARLDFQLPTETARHYAAIVAHAFDYLHARSIVYRDLKPENLVLDKHGHLKIVDFGFAKRVDSLTYTLCGTPEYLAPEIVSGKGHNKGADYWALGILIYEMTYGNSPFADDNGDQMVIYKNIIRGNLHFPHSNDRRVVSLITSLLRNQMSKRLGLQKGGAKDILNHSWFKSIDFDALHRQEIQPPIVPTTKGNLDTSNFEGFDPDNEPPVPYVPAPNAVRWEREFG